MSRLAPPARQALPVLRPQTSAGGGWEGAPQAGAQEALAGARSAPVEVPMWSKRPQGRGPDPGIMAFGRPKARSNREQFLISTTRPCPFLKPPSLHPPVEGLTIALLAALGFGASFIDAQVGGGGVLTLPALLLSGLHPATALGTNKLGGTASALIACANYIHKRSVPLRPALLFAPLSLLGGAIGVWAVLHAPDTGWLVPAVMVVMVAMGAWVLLRPRFGTIDHTVTGILPFIAMALAALCIGTYDGILGPGTGSMLLFALVSFLGYGFRRAAALGRVLNLASNVSALAYFIWAGRVDWEVGIPMAASMAVGGYVGSHVTLRHGDRVVKPLFVVMTAVLLASLAWRFTQ